MRVPGTRAVLRHPPLIYRLEEHEEGDMSESLSLLLKRQSRYPKIMLQPAVPGAPETGETQGSFSLPNWGEGVKCGARLRRLGIFPIQFESCATATVGGGALQNYSLSLMYPALL